MLLERYATLVGGVVFEMGDQVLEMEIPERERAFFDGRERIRVALTPDGLDEDEDAEMLILGSRLFAQVIEAIRSRGGHHRFGEIERTESPVAGGMTLGASVERAEVKLGKTSVLLVPVGRLLARVSIQAGPAMEERLVESSIVDLTTGMPVADEMAALVDAQDYSKATWVETPLRGEGPRSSLERVATREPAELLPILLTDLEKRLAPELERIAADAERECKQELARLDAYYGRLADDLDPEDSADEGRKAIEADHARRREEEERRYRVKVAVHPVHLVEWDAPAQRVGWILVTPRGHRGDLTTTRFLAGDTAWRLACPTCGAVPNALRVCRKGHVGCRACATWCTVCGEACCDKHGATKCPVDGLHAVCGEHVATCSSCRRPHCATHTVTCKVGNHRVCNDCLHPCGRCGTAACRAHSTRTRDDAPKGARWLCTACAVSCEGGSDETVGLDEVATCASCDRHVCTAHQAVCAVDGKVQCSRHLRRTDSSGRLVCEEHRAECADEPAAVLATDEVKPCLACGRVTCDKHGAACVVDNRHHCLSHLTPLTDRPGSMACAHHRTTCHVDGAAYSTTGTQECPVCGHLACEAHRTTCPWCARQVCVKDKRGEKCVTCSRLEPVGVPGDALIGAALLANAGEPPSARSWLTARDAHGTVVELDLGWTRRLVFSVPHGQMQPKTVVRHSAMGRKRVR